MKSDLKNIVKLFAPKGKLNKLGVARDLAIIQQKIEKGEYLKGFVPANKFDVPTRTEGLFREMEFLLQLGHDWDRLLGVLHLERFDKIVDLCPGYTPKIELGLYFGEYKGKISILDIDKRSIDSLERFMKLFSPKFKIVKVVKNLFGRKLPKYKVVLGNHIIDDLVVYYFCSKENVSLKDFYAKEEIAEKVWRKILLNKGENANEVSTKISEIIDHITQKTGYVCLTQYKSYSEKLFGMSGAYNFNKKVFMKIFDILIDKGYSSKQELLSKAFIGYKGHFDKKDCLLLQKNDN
jgi:hypothetical protein